MGRTPRHLGFIAGAVLAGCTVGGATDGTVVAWTETLRDASGASHEVRWQRHAGGWAAELVAAGVAFDGAREGDWWALRDARGEVVAALRPGSPLRVRVLGEADGWFDVESDGVDPRVAALQQDEGTPAGDEAVARRALGALSARAVELAVLARGYELATAVPVSPAPDGTVAARREAIITILWERTMRALLAKLSQQLLMEGLTPDCNGDVSAAGILDCYDCCDDAWVGHYPSLQNCYLSCGEVAE